MDEPERVRRGRADPDGQRRGRSAHPLVAEDRAGGRQPRAARAVAGGPRRPRPPHRRRAPGALRLQDHLVRAGHGDAAPGLEGYGYGIDPGRVAKIWRAGCIIRASLLGDIRSAFERDPGLVNLLLDDAFRDAIGAAPGGLARCRAAAIGLGIPVPAMGSSLAYYDSYRAARLPANLTQAQRDFFGAHTYRRVDRDGMFHTQWTGNPRTPGSDTH